MKIEYVTRCCGTPDKVYEKLSDRVTNQVSRIHRLEEQLKQERKFRGQAQRIIGKLLMKNFDYSDIEIHKDQSFLNGMILGGFIVGFLTLILSFFGLSLKG